VERRHFLKTGALSTGAWLISRHAGLAAPSDSRIEVLLDEPIGTISRNIYGHFTEHLGGVIYDGVWVGEDSKIPNVGGIRKQLVDGLREIHAPVIRWPGGCFADSYDWRDGVGERNKRPTRTNFWVDEPANQPGPSPFPANSVQLYETNAFGTAEFMRFCKLSGAEPYVAANLRSLPPIEFDRWVEYCNSPTGSTTLARERAAGGSPEPYNVRYWGVGNESWGCGGNFTPEEYAMEFRRLTTWVPSYGVDLAFVGSGPNSNDLEWTNRFFEHVFQDRPDVSRNFFGWSAHYYTWNLSRGKTRDWDAGKGDALKFDTVDWYELFRQAIYIEQIIGDQWAVMGSYDAEHRIKLVVDEYGPWYRPGTALDPSHLIGQQATLRDALMTALTLDIFNRNAEKVGMAANAQLANCLNALFFTHEDHFVVSPNFYVFKMYAAHQDAAAVKSEFSAPGVQYLRDGKPADFWGLNGSASRKRSTLTLTVVNPSVDTPRQTEVVLRGATPMHATAEVLTNADLHAHNTFEHQAVTEPKPEAVSVNGSALQFTFPPASVTKLSIGLS
jgi:alpha-L-arabinofuranosidase